MPERARRMKRQHSEQELSMSQSSNFDGNEEAMSILLKAQATVAKNKKQKENQHLKDTKDDLTQVLKCGAMDYAEFVNELKEVSETFQMELASSHDRERKYWMEVIAEQGRFKTNLHRIARLREEGDETREKMQIDALALARSSMNAIDDIISKTMFL